MAVITTTILLDFDFVVIINVIVAKIKICKSIHTIIQPTKCVCDQDYYSSHFPSSFSELFQIQWVDPPE
jgi:hypothetical protein